jgi:hypothetical protein
MALLQPAATASPMLIARGILGFASGCGCEHCHGRNAPLVKKPFTGRDLLAAVARF